MSNSAKNLDILATSLSVLHNYLMVQTKLFSDLYLAKFLNTSAFILYISFCIYIYIYI